jgi:hypothetical protein
MPWPAKHLKLGYSGLGTPECPIPRLKADIQTKRYGFSVGFFKIIIQILNTFLN